MKQKWISNSKIPQLPFDRSTLLPQFRIKGVAAMALLSRSRPIESLSIPTTRDSSPHPIHTTAPSTLLNELGAGDTESILCLLIRDERVYAGSQGGDIHVST